MTKKKIVLTFDYELYLGEDSGTIEKCMIEPTDRILEILGSYHAKGLFFVDATFLVVLKRDYYDGYLKVKQQILDMLEQGSDVGLHIHPHWIDAYMIEKDRWSFKKYDNFRIHNLNETLKKKVIQEAFDELDTICKAFDSHYTINSFRAGGWSVQPFDYIKDELKEIGIKYDFSVLPSMVKNILPKHFYDYATYPKNSDFWKFEDDVVLENQKGSFIEIPTTIIKMNIFNTIQLKRHIRKLKVIGDGRGADTTSSGFLGKIKKLKPFMRYTLSSDYMSLERFRKNIEKIDRDLLVYVAHPKNFSEVSFEILAYIAKEHRVVEYRSII